MRNDKFMEAADAVQATEAELDSMRKDNKALTLILLFLLLALLAGVCTVAVKYRQEKAGWDRTFARQDSIIQECHKKVGDIDSLRTIYPLMTPAIKREVERTYRHFHRELVEYNDTEDMR